MFVSLFRGVVVASKPPWPWASIALLVSAMLAHGRWHDGTRDGRSCMIMWDGSRWKTRSESCDQNYKNAPMIQYASNALASSCRGSAVAWMHSNAPRWVGNAMKSVGHHEIDRKPQNRSKITELPLYVHVEA